MLNIITNRRSPAQASGAPAVAIVASRDRRALVKHALGPDIQVVAELESSERIHLLDAVEPDVIFIDTLSPKVNPFTAREAIRRAGIGARVVLLGSDWWTAAANLPSPAAA